MYGIDAHLIDVEVDLWASGNARDFITVGMPDTAVRESRERIKSALLNSGFGYPNKAVTINLAPANVRKEGAGFDLPMAVGILGAMGRAPKSERTPAGGRTVAGRHRPAGARRAAHRCLRPREPTGERGRAAGERGGGRRGRGCARCSAVKHLSEVVALLERPDEFTAVSPVVVTPGQAAAPALDFGDVRGQDSPRSGRWKWPPPACTTC